MRFLAISALCLLAARTLVAEPMTVRIERTQTNGIVRALHGVNKGPVAFGGLINLTKEFRAAGIPHVRLHDCDWPYPDVVDIHAIFRNPDADPKVATSYDFALTDDYLAETIASGARIIYRLGESIEHGKTKRFVRPPRDVEKWTEICRAIIRHYNDGWSDGFRHNIQYWEIWNEPENRPAMWTGSDEEFFALYRAAAKGLKRDFPALKFGGPGLGRSGELKNGALAPSEFLRKFLALCRDENVPLDFFSWHCYTDDPQELVIRAKALRKLLDAHGFTKAELHLNEWNYLPNKSWTGVSAKATPQERAEFEAQMTSPKAAAFAAANLIALQDAPVDVANFFHGETGVFGLFDQHGAPTPIYRVFTAFNRLAGKARASAAQPAGVYAIATSDRAFIAAISPARIKVDGMGSGRTIVDVLTEKREPLRDGIIEASGPGVWIIE